MGSVDHLIQKILYETAISLHIPDIHMFCYSVALCCDILHQRIYLCLEISVCYGAGQCEFERAVTGLCFLCIRDLCHLIYFIYSDCHEAASLFVSGYTYVHAVTIFLLCN